MQEKVQELTAKLREVTFDKTLLQVELEELKQQQQDPSQQTSLLSSPDLAVTSLADSATAFVTSGNGVYPKRLEFNFANLHGSSNPSACALSSDETVLATGGADSNLVLLAWGAAYSNATAKNIPASDHDKSPTQALVDQALRVPCSAPVIAIHFSDSLRNVVSAGCMDGSVQVVAYAHGVVRGGPLQAIHTTVAPQMHSKYVRAVAWHKDLLATASADGSIHVYRVTKTADDTMDMHFLKSLHLPGSVEAMTFVQQRLVAYARNTSYLAYFDITDDAFALLQSPINAATGNGGFDDHVSFCILDLQPSHNGKYLAAATDASRNIILDAAMGRQIRNLYGHQNDGYSQPKVAWSANDEYLLGNTQESGNVVVWDIATSRIVEQLSGHTKPIRDLCCSASDCLVTTSFDKDTKVWFPAE